MGNNTYWLDVNDKDENGVAEDGFMMDFVDDKRGAVSATNAAALKKADDSGKKAPMATTQGSMGGSSLDYKAESVPGKLAICRNCGAASNDFNLCIRCKEPIPSDCKMIDDGSKKGTSCKYKIAEDKKSDL